MLVDYHLHSNFSFDGTQSLRELCEAAVSRGLSEIAVTEHMDLYKDKPYGYILDCQASFRELENMKSAYKGKLVIRRGIELGQPMRNPQEEEKFLKDYELDFIIGSIHNMEGDIDAGDIDYTRNDMDQVFSHYLDWELDLALHYPYDVLGHITYPARYMALQTGKQPDYEAVRDKMDAVLKAAISRGKGIELNTSSLARGEGPLMPTKDILRRYRELGGEIITMGSDAHVSSQVGTTARAGQEILKECGFSHFATFEDHRATMHPLEV